MSFKKTIGIIGGAGPIASAYLYSALLKICQSDYGAADFHQYPHIVLVSYPFVRGQIEKITSDLSSCFNTLKSAGASVIGLACNTFHGLLPPFSGAEFVHLIESSLNKAKSLSLSKPLILATQKTVEFKLYEQEGLDSLYPTPDEQGQVNAIIREVMRGHLSQGQTQTLQKIISQHPEADGVLLACTELPPIHQAFPLDLPIPIVDTVDVLARELLEKAR
ncbi:MAG: aspartate/glutamate racemase family protein [Verrucomicrobia bacterium]|nr:aspartate/glutamate racemase family protein [Verrucomicrobiota bacterium]